MRDQPCKPRLRHGAAPGEPENLIRRGDAGAPQPRALKAHPGAEAQPPPGRGARARSAPGPPRAPAARERPCTPNSAAMVENWREYRRMQVKMLVGVHVIERQAGRAEGLELGADLRLHLPAHVGQKKHRGAGQRHIRPKRPRAVDQVRARPRPAERASRRPAPDAGRPRAAAAGAPVRRPQPPPALRPSGSPR